MIDEESGGRAGARRRALVAAAFQRIASGGFEGLRTRDVAADAGVNIATLHYYFPTKEALIRAVIGYAVGRFHETMPAQGAAIDQLRGHLRALRQLLRDDPRLWAVMGELVLRAPRDASLAQIFRQTDEFWHRMLADLLRKGIAEAAIDAQVDADGTAALLIVAIKGLSLPTVAGARPEVADQVFQQFERVLGLPLS